MLGESSHKIIGGVAGYGPFLRSQVFPQEFNFPVRDFDEAMLSNRQPSNVPTGIPEEMGFRREMSQVDAPPSLGLNLQDQLEVFNVEIRREYLCL
jgi:hypothetical protein